MAGAGGATNRARSAFLSNWTTLVRGTCSMTSMRSGNCQRTHPCAARCAWTRGACPGQHDLMLIGHEEHRAWLTEALSSRCGCSAPPELFAQPIAASASSGVVSMHVNEGTSRTVCVDASLSRISWTRSRKSATESLSKATTNSWSSSPNE